MITETALVIDYQHGIATVQCQSHTACGNCAAQTACGTASLTKLGGKKQHILQVQTITPLKIGQHVEIGLPERSLLSSVLIAYFLPLLILLISTFVSEGIISNELIRTAFIFFFTALSFLFIRQYSKKIQQNSHYQPILLRVL